jgi:hypothetical protein
MQQERLRISGFAGLDGAEIGLGRINLFIGPQASGKSVAAKVLYFIKTFCDDAVQAITQGLSYTTFAEERVRQFDRYFPPAFRSQNGFRIEYTLNDASMVIEGGKKMVTTISAPVWERMYREAGEHCKGEKESLVKNSMTPQMAVVLLFEAVFLKRWLPTPQIFIPDGRGNQFFFEELLKSGEIKTQDMLDPFMVEYQKAYSWANRYLAKNDSDWWEAFAGEMRPVLRGIPIDKEGETYIHSEDGRDVLLGFASSGQKEVLPIFKILSFLSALQLNQQWPTVYLEEPEAHLFPESQIRLVNLMAALFNRARTLQGLVTTHSPYVAASLNNLLYAGQLGVESDAARKAQVGAIVPEGCWLSAEDFRAYRLGDGQVTSAMDPETQLIQADVIDSASNETGAVFDRLVELDDRG